MNCPLKQKLEPHKEVSEDVREAVLEFEKELRIDNGDEYRIQMYHKLKKFKEIFGEWEE